MFTRSKMRFSIKSEDEAAKNQRIFEEKVQQKRLMIRSEFEFFQQKQDFADFSQNTVKFKQEIDDFRIKNHKKLAKLASLSTLFPRESCDFSIFPEKSRENDENLRAKLENQRQKLEKLENSLAEQLICERSLRAKAEEFVQNINFFKKNSENLKYLCNLSDKRFKFLEVLRINSKNKEVTRFSWFFSIKVAF